MARPRAEIGEIGLPIYAGRISLDKNPRLRWPYAGTIYQVMMDDEPSVGALRQAVHTLLRSDFQVSAGDESRMARRAAEHVEACLLELRDPPGTKLRQMAGSWFFGFSIHELVYKRRADGTVGWKDWALRRQSSFQRWERVGDEVTAFTQRPAPDFTLRTIPLTKAVHLVADDADGSPEGRGVLRSMYRYWYMVTQFELLAGIALERFGTGMPVFSRTEASASVTLTDQQLNDLETIAASVRQNEAAYVLEPSGIKFRFEASPGLNAATYLDFIRAYRTWMLATGMAEFIALGTGDTGSYALGSSKIALFLKALTGVQDRICEGLNRQAIPRLMRLNGWGDVPAPRVALPPVREYDLQALGSFAQVLQNIGAFHPTPQDEEWFRKISDLADVSMDEIERMHGVGKDQPADAAAPDGTPESEQIFGYHIEQGVVDLNEARARLGLPPRADVGTDLRYREKLAALRLAQQATAAGYDTETALAMAGLTPDGELTTAVALNPQDAEEEPVEEERPTQVRGGIRPDPVEDSPAIAEPDEEDEEDEEDAIATEEDEEAEDETIAEE